MYIPLYSLYNIIYILLARHHQYHHRDLWREHQRISIVHYNSHTDISLVFLNHSIKTSCWQNSNLRLIQISTSILTEISRKSVWERRSSRRRRTMRRVMMGERGGGEREEGEQEEEESEHCEKWTRRTVSCFGWVGQCLWMPRTVHSSSRGCKMILIRYDRLSPPWFDISDQVPPTYLL